MSEAPTETAISRVIQTTLTRAGYWVIRLQSSGRRSSRTIASGEPGLPDLMVLGPSGFLEVKTSTGKLSAEQVAWHARARRKGVRVAVVRSAGEAFDVVRAGLMEATGG